MTAAGTPGEAAEAGAQLIRAAQVMDRLRSPGGCPWDAEQTHTSLAPYLLEEAYETLEAIETSDLVALREELGDLLLQVLFHARLAEEAPAGQRFGIDDVAADLVAKLVRRHPHVFDQAPDAPSGLTADGQQTSWDAIKKAEKRRESVTDGIAMGQPALALATKLVSRSSRAGLQVALPAGDGIGERLLAVVADAVRAGVDPEHALRQSARDYREAVRARELSGPTGE
ncbi:MazG family protein [Jatrophihabitans sp.]|uniref:MazG family protein n=1 Tax=Jatrophihabitans sp. TaxID=1932789 RepID=UPI002BBE76C3|nr:MazG family protein [Jatrophihabitans sp.]